MNSEERAHQIARTWAAWYPRLKTRIERALALVPNVKLVESSGAFSKYSVLSSNKTYTISVNHISGHAFCTCADSGRGNHCKHRIAISIFYLIATTPQPIRITP